MVMHFGWDAPRKFKNDSWEDPDEFMMNRPAFPSDLKNNQLLGKFIICFVVLMTLFILWPQGAKVDYIFCYPGDSVFASRDGEYQVGTFVSMDNEADTIMVRFRHDNYLGEVPAKEVLKNRAVCKSAWPHCQRLTGVNYGVESTANLLFSGPMIDLTFYQALLPEPLDPEFCRNKDCTYTDKFSSPEAVECASVCAHTPTCKYWYWGFEKNTNMCWLLAHQLPDHPEGFVSGYRECTPGMWDASGFQASLGRISANDQNVLQRMSAVTLHHCASICRIWLQCSQFQYRTITGNQENCLLLQAKPDYWAAGKTVGTMRAFGWVLYHRLPKTHLPGIKLIGTDHNNGLFIDWRSDTSTPTGLPIPMAMCHEKCFFQKCKAALWTEESNESEAVDIDVTNPLGYCYLSNKMAQTPRPCPSATRCASFRTATSEDLLMQISELEYGIEHGSMGEGVASSEDMGFSR